MALHRVMALRENLSLELRAEFFNVFNHTQFETVQGNFNSAAFGDATAARVQGLVR